MIALALALSLAAAADEVVARVDGQVVLASDLAARATQPAAAPETLQELIGEAALAAEAARLGLDKDPRVVAEVEARRRRLAADRLVEKEIASAVVPTDEMIRGLYRSQADAVKLEMLVLTSREEAQASLERLRKGAAFASEAPRSVEQSWRNGKAQVRSRASLDKLADPVFAAAVGEWTGPQQLALGVAVFRVLERTLGDEKGYQERREGLTRFAAQQLRGEARSHYLAQLRRQAAVKLDEPFIRSTEKRLDATPAELAHPVAVIHGRPLTWGEILPEVRDLSRGKSSGHFSGTSVKLEVASQLVDRRLLEEAALSRGHGKAPEVEAALGGARRDALVRARSQDLRASLPAPAASEVDAYYRANQAQFQLPGRRACSHVLLRTRELADAARKRIQVGEKFEDVAQASSIDTASAAAGGRLGEITDEQLEAFAREEAQLAAALRKARPGEVEGPVQSRSGWHLLRCEPHQAARPAPLAEVSPRIAAELARRRGDDAIRARIADARRVAKVTIDEAAMQRALPRAQ